MNRKLCLGVTTVAVILLCAAGGGAARGDDFPDAVVFYDQGCSASWMTWGAADSVRSFFNVFGFRDMERDQLEPWVREAVRRGARETLLVINRDIVPDWLVGDTPIFSEASSGRWFCVEGHVRLNSVGQSNGLFEFWIDDALEARNDALNWRGSWDDYGINAVFFENYWNDGAPEELRRWFDDLAVATVRIGCD